MRFTKLELDGKNHEISFKDDRENTFSEMCGEMKEFKKFLEAFGCNIFIPQRMMSNNDIFLGVSFTPEQCKNLMNYLNESRSM